MPWHCSVCARPDVRKVNDALIRGVPRRRVGREFGIHHSTLDRHWWRCIPEDVAEAAAAGETEGIDVFDGRALLEAMQAQMMAAASLFQELERRLLDPKQDVDSRSVVASLREVRASIEATAKLSFAVQDRPSPPTAEERPELDDAILNALRARDLGVEAAPSSAGTGEVLALPAAPQG